jgi:hypothetical protein
LREGVVVPEPGNKVIDLIDPRSLSNDNEEFVLTRYASEYDVLARTRSRGKTIEALSPYRLAPFEQDQILDTMDRHFRRVKRRDGVRCLVVGLITMPFTATALALSLCPIVPVRLFLLAVVAFPVSIGMFFKGWYHLVQCKWPLRP